MTTPHGQLTAGTTHHGQMEGELNEQGDGQSSEWQYCLGHLISQPLPSLPLHHAKQRGWGQQQQVCVWKWDDPSHCCLSVLSTTTTIPGLFALELGSSGRDSGIYDNRIPLAPLPSHHLPCPLLPSSLAFSTWSWAAAVVEVAAMRVWKWETTSHCCHSMLCSLTHSSAHLAFPLATCDKLSCDDLAAMSCQRQFGGGKLVAASCLFCISYCYSVFYKV